MKRFVVKWLKILLLIGMTIIIFTSCIETEQDISYKDGWYHYDCRFSVDKSLGLFLLAWSAMQDFFQDSQQDESDKAMGKLLLSDYYWTISIEESLLPHGVSTAYLTDEAWESTQVDCERFGNRLIVKIPMAEFIDGASYTHLCIY